MEQQSLHLDPVWLRQKYELEGLSANAIARLVDKTPKTVYRALVAFGIPTRPRGTFYPAGRTPTKSPLQDILTCGICGHRWKYEGVYKNTPCPACGKIKDARNRKGWSHGERNNAQTLETLKEFYATPGTRRLHKKGYMARQRFRVLLRLSRPNLPACVRCGCNDTRLLEINHKNGGGTKENQETHHSKFYRNILTGNRATDDLELLCRPCNALHYLELLYGPLPMRVVWEGNPE